MHPKDIAAAIRRLRAASLALLDRCSDADLELEALPGWTVLDVFRHLADSDRGSVLGGHLVEFLPGRDLLAFERVNDANLERLRGCGRAEVRDELERWGKRLATVVSIVPGRVGRLPIPTAFGRVPLAWMGALRPYDEWVHQWDVSRALGLPDPAMDTPTRDLLAEFQLRALPAGPLRSLPRTEAVVEVRLPDTSLPAWRFDLATHRFGPRVTAPATATVVTDVPTFCLVAGARRPWRELDVTVDGEDRAAAESLLDVVRVV